jgi:glutathione S-transferase
MTELLGITYSPWSEKARWALDARGVAYTFRFYQPLLGEPALRIKLRRPVGRVSVPVLTTDAGEVIAESVNIARWADRQGGPPTLFPAERDAAIARFSDLSERALAAGRALSLRRMLADDAALAEMVPGPLRRALGPAAKHLGRIGVARTLRKYRGHEAGEEVHREVLVEALDELRAALAKAPAPEGGPKTIFGALTYADIAVAQVLIFVEPAADGPKLGKASRKAFADDDLRAKYPDLLAWRDDLYRALRRR